VRLDQLERKRHIVQRQRAVFHFPIKPHLKVNWVALWLTDSQGGLGVGQLGFNATVSVSRFVTLGKFFTSLSLRVHSYKIGMSVVPNTGSHWGFKCNSCVKCSAQCLTGLNFQ
jgi:hypothetical protein